MSVRKEYLATIEQQKDKIFKYETKLTDLIRAYKNLQKEKDALQNSLSALSEGPQKIDAEENDDSSQSQKEPNADGDSRATDETKTILSLEHRVEALTKALNTLSDQKTKTETNLKEDRKRLLSDKNKAESELETLSLKHESTQSSLESKIKELKSKIIVVQHEREQEISNGMIMLREVEGRLSKERSEKEKLESNLEEIKRANRKLRNEITSKNKEQHDDQIVDLKKELEKVRLRLQKAEEQCKDPPMMRELHSQLEDLKQYYSRAIYQEQVRSEKAEMTCKTLSSSHEERVGSLEMRLQELSITAANKDKKEQTYLDTIQVLKDKLSDVVHRNEKQIASPNQNPVRTESNSKLSSPNKIKMLWNLMDARDEQLDLKEFFSSNDIIHEDCRFSQDGLKKELEFLKQVSAKSVKSSMEECMCGLQQQLDMLKERIKMNMSSAQSTQAKLSCQIEDLSQQLLSTKQFHQDTLNRTLMDHRAKIASLEHQMSDHCQRSLSTLQQRDEEIHTLTQDLHRMSKEAKLQPSTIAAALISQVGANATGSAATDGPLLHHLEEMARKQLELNQLRLDKRQLERTLREIQVNSVEKQEKLQEEVEDLREELRRYQRNMTREGSSLEYLKNVVVQYMTTSDGDARLSMANAIATILKFSPEEVNRVRIFLGQYWWQSRPTDGARHRLASYNSQDNSPSTKEGGTGGRRLSTQNF